MFNPNITHRELLSSLTHDIMLQMTYTTVRFGAYEVITGKLLEGRDGELSCHSCCRFTAKHDITPLLELGFLDTRCINCLAVTRL